MVSLCSNLAARRKSFLRQLANRVIVASLLWLCAFAVNARATDTNTLIDSWFSAQANMRTWSADFTQTRTLKALSRPLTAPGKIWFQAPDTFRWEVGDPVQSVAMRKDDQLLVIYPRLKRVERYKLSSKAFGQFRDALALLDAGFPRNRTQLETHFNIASVVETNDAFQLTLQPKSASARRFMNEIQLGFRKSPFAMVSIDVKFSDGSTMRNDFKNEQLNPALPENTFDTNPQPGFTVIEPLGQ